MRTVMPVLFAALLVLAALVTPATAASPFPTPPVDLTGTHVWQIQKFCNKFVLTISETGVITGYDDDCGRAAGLAGIHGAAFVFKGSWRMVLTRIGPLGSAAHVMIKLAAGSMSGTMYPDIGPASAFLYLGPAAE